MMYIKLATKHKLKAILAISCFLLVARVNSYAQPSYRIVPRVRVGAITPNTSESDLRRIYGRRNVRSTRVSIGEGEYEPGTVVYPNDPLRMIEIIWKDAGRRRYPQRIQLTGERSVWTTRHRISLGTSLKELERINGRPFVLTGFGWDYAGTVVSWGGGRLEREFERGGRTVLLRLDDQTDNRVSVKDAGSVAGDRDFPSNNRAMQQINPKVYQLIIEFP